MKKFVTVLVVVSFLFVGIVPAFAENSSSEQLPAELVEAGAAGLTDAQAGEIQGEASYIKMFSTGIWFSGWNDFGDTWYKLGHRVVVFQRIGTEKGSKYIVANGITQNWDTFNYGSYVLVMVPTAYALRNSNTWRNVSLADR